MSQRLKIDTLSSEGEGIGSLEGLKVFVEGALPGEVCEVEIQDLKKNFAKAKRLKIIEASPHRQEPICKIFGACGGCQLMHLAYEEQLRVKQDRVRDALKRIGHLDVEVAPCRPSPSQLHYRNKIQLPVVWEQETMKIGLYKKNSHEIIPINECHIQGHTGEKILQALRPLLQTTQLRTLLIRTSKHEAQVVLVTWGKEDLKDLALKILAKLPQVVGVVENINTKDNNVILSPKWRLLAGKDHLIETLLNKRFKISAGAFFQVNTEQAEHLFAEVLKLANLQKTDTVWDAYCGVGTLALLTSDHVKSVIGTEAFPQAITDAKENARLNNATNCEFITIPAEDFKQPNTDVVFLNPPRKGCAEKLLTNLTANRLIYISCDPATLARDVSLLTKRGYKVTSVQPFDMFPQTSHVETLIALHL